MCKKCNNTGAIVTLYKDGHEDIHLCNCEYNPYTQLKKLKEENLILKSKVNLYELGLSEDANYYI